MMAVKIPSDREVAVARQNFAALASILLCLILSGCGNGFVSDQSLKDQFSDNRVDYENLVRLFERQPVKEISTDKPRPDTTNSGADSENQRKIYDLLTKLKAISIAKSPGEITVQIKVVDADLLRGRHYYFDYRMKAPHKVVPSLYDPQEPYDGEHFMQLADHWYASVYEDH